MQQQKCVPAQCNKIHQLEQCFFCYSVEGNKMQQKKCMPAQCNKIHQLEQWIFCSHVEGNKMQHTEMCACSMQQDPPARTMLVLFSVEGNKMQQKKCVPAQCNKIHQLEQCFFCSLLKTTSATTEMCACSMQQDPPAGTMDLLFSVEGNKMQQQKCVPAQCNKIHQLEQCLFCSLLKATRCNKRNACLLNATRSTSWNNGSFVLC